MIYVTGDTHGNNQKWFNEIERVLKPNDILIVCGDFGVGFWDGMYWSEELFYDRLADTECTILFIDGNHDDIDKLNAMPVDDWCGGRVHKIRENIIHLMRGEVYDIDGNTIFAMGGGYSIDNAKRTQGVDWWENEMPSSDEYQNALNNLEIVNNKVDYIITHTAPSKAVNYLCELHESVNVKCAKEERPLTDFLDDVCKRVSYKRWYFGHFHVDEVLDRDDCQNQIAMISTVRRLENGDVVRRWNKYERGH